MSKSTASAEILLTTQIDHVLRRNRAVQRRPAERSPEMQRASSLLCDQLESLVCGEWPQTASE
ncbi:MAG: hypothetical protein WD733_15370 [Bryobacterales bacterium]